MKYLILIILFFLSSCIGSDNKTVKPLNDLIYNDDKPLKKVKNQIIKENKSSLKKKVIKKENKNSYKKKTS